MSSVAIYKLWVSWKTIIEMFDDRRKHLKSEKYSLDSYFPADSENHDTSYESFMNWLDSIMEKKYERIEGYKDFMDKLNEDEDITEINQIREVINFNTDTVSVFWKDSVGISDVQSIIESLQEHGTSHAIVIYGNKITPTAAAAIKPLRFQKIIMETFSEKELQYNVTRHEDVPLHIICTEATKQKVFKVYNIDKEKCPKIPVTDPVCRYYGATKGQLIKIKRKSDTIPEVIVNGEKKILYDITYKLVG